MDFVIRGLVAGLIEDPTNESAEDPWPLPKSPWEAAKLLAVDPIDTLEAKKMPVETIYWIAIQFYPTELLQNVLKKYNLDCWESPPNPEFIAWLENRFAEYGVPFSHEPLMPIQPPMGKDA